MSTHNAKIIPPTRNVLPTWRGTDIPTPSIIAANLPLARFAKISRPAASCHGSNVIPSFTRQVCSTCGQPVETIPVGAETFRANSDSRGVEGFVGASAVIASLLLHLRVQQPDLLIDLPQLPRQWSQRMR